MKIFAALLLLLSQSAIAASLVESVDAIESEWAKIHYGMPKDKQSAAYKLLLQKTDDLAKEYPKAAEPIYWQAVIKANNAEHEGGVDALNSIQDVKALLEKSIEINPKAMDGSAYVVLGTLYYMTPAWPIAFGDNDEAEEKLKEALKINPKGIDSNFYYGDFLMSKGQHKAAELFLNNAIAAPVRPNQTYVDNELKKEAKAALENAKKGKSNDSNSIFSSLFGS